MRHLLLAAGVASATVMLSFTAAQATDVLSQDDKAHNLTVTSKEGKKVVQIAAKGEARNICDGCTIMLENGQSVEPKAGDIVFLNKGELSIYED